MELAEPWQGGMIDRLNAVLPGGFRVLEGRPLVAIDGVRKVSLSVEAALGLYEVDLSGLGEEERSAVPHSIERFTAAAEWIVRRGRSEDDIRVVDLKRACVGVSWEPGSRTLRLTLRLIDPEGQTANPARVLGGVFGLDAEAQARCFVIRTALLREDGGRI